MIEATGAEHAILHKDAFAYSAHPHLVALDDGDWLIVFNKTIRRRLILHPPQDPEFRNWLMRSSDGGRCWSAPQAVPGYDWHGVECAGLTPLGQGRVMLNQWRFRWYPLDTARKRLDAATLAFPARLLRGLALSPELDVDRALLDGEDARFGRLTAHAALASHTCGDATAGSIRAAPGRADRPSGYEGWARTHKGGPIGRALRTPPRTARMAG